MMGLPAILSSPRQPISTGEESHDKHSFVEGALVSDVDRDDTLKLISHKDPIRISEDVLLGAMSMQW